MDPARWPALASSDWMVFVPEGTVKMRQDPELMTVRVTEASPGQFSVQQYRYDPMNSRYEWTELMTISGPALVVELPT